MRLGIINNFEVAHRYKSDIVVTCNGQVGYTFTDNHVFGGVGSTHPVGWVWNACNGDGVLQASYLFKHQRDLAMVRILNDHADGIGPTMAARIVHYHGYSTLAALISAGDSMRIARDVNRLSAKMASALCTDVIKKEMLANDITCTCTNTRVDVAAARSALLALVGTLEEDRLTTVLARSLADNTTECDTQYVVNAYLASLRS